jgi:four helix bundle protein
MRESNYWLRILKEAQLVKSDDLQLLIDESEELKKILGKIVSKSKK